MFGRIAPRYDLANRILSGGIDIYWRQRLVAAVRESDPRDVLDLATGSGDVAYALAAALPPSSRVVGADFCAPMLAEAEAKRGRRPGAHASLIFSLADALALPFPGAAFDAVTIAFGLRNMADRARCLAEIARVLRPGGRLLILEFSQPARWFRPFYSFYLGRVIPAVAGLLTGDRSAYEYLGGSIGAFPGRQGLSLEIAAAGFEAVDARPLTFGVVALHVARRGS